MTQLADLARPFKREYVNRAAPGKHGDYVSHDVVTQKLLAVCGPFSFNVVEIIRNSDGIVDGCLARLELDIDGRYVCITEVGECENPAVQKTDGDRLKKAASDAIKRCAMRVGVGLHLWSGDQYFLHKYLQEAGE